MVYCANCGRLAGADDAFCAKCGRKIPPDEPPEATAATISAGPPETSQPFPLGVNVTPPAPLPVYRNAMPPSSQPVFHDGYRRKNWFERHLNWTWVLGILAFYLLQIGIGFVYGFTKGASGAYVTELELNNMSNTAWLVSLLFVYIPVTGWVLKKKNRSLWFILVSGFFFLTLWIENKSKE